VVSHVTGKNRLRQFGQVTDPCLMTAPIAPNAVQLCRQMEIERGNVWEDMLRWYGGGYKQLWSVLTESVSQQADVSDSP